jgi:hypothetical protein
MITTEEVTFTAQGVHFTPSKVVAPFSAAHDPGVLGKRGRYRGLPVPYGAADFDVPKEEKEKIAYLHRTVLPHLAAMRASGAEEFRVHITYHYESQCAVGFSKEEIRLLSELECEVPIDCWRKEEPNQSPEPTSGLRPAVAHL